MGDDPDVIGPLQFHKSAMGGVGHGLTDGPATLVVEVEDQPGIPPRNTSGAMASRSRTVSMEALSIGLQEEQRAVRESSHPSR